MRRILDYLSQHALAAAAFACSILALAGSSYAAFTINGRQIVNHTIAPTKFDPKFINGSVRAWAVVGPDGHVWAGAGVGRASSAGAAEPGFYTIRWRVNFPGRCATVASVDFHLSPSPQVPGGLPAGFAVASSLGSPPNRNRGAQTVVATSNASGQPTPKGFDIAVIC